MKNKNIKYIFDIRNKIKNTQYFIDIMLNRTTTMFRYTGLPESLPEQELEKILQCNGCAIITKHEGELVALAGSYAPPLDIYYRSKNFLVNNPWAGINKTFEIGKDCVLIKNDPLSKGLLPIFRKYGTMTSEADLTLSLATTNLRAIYSIVAGSDSEKESALEFLRQIEDGRQGVMMEEEFSNGIKTNPLASISGGYITQIIELEQYLRGSFYNEIGLNANYNMKRERLVGAEVELNEDGLRPLIDAMIEERQTALAKVNEMFGTNIQIEFGSSWSQYNEIDEIDEEESAGASSYVDEETQAQVEEQESETPIEEVEQQEEIEQNSIEEQQDEQEQLDEEETTSEEQEEVEEETKDEEEEKEEDKEKEDK